MFCKLNYHYRVILLCVLVSSILANGFAYFNLAPHHDALNHTMFFAGNWEISLGRFFLPVYKIIHGDLLMPWFNGFLSIIYISLSVFLISRILEITDIKLLSLTACFMSVNYTIIELCGTFTFALDSYILSLLFSCLGVYIIICSNGKLIGRILRSGFFFFLSLGIYQSFITVALLLFSFVAMQKLLREEIEWKKTLISWITWGLALSVGAFIYFIGYKLSLFITGVVPPETYNSLSNLSIETLNIKLFTQVFELYKDFGKLFFFVENFADHVILKTLNIILMFMTLVSVAFQTLTRDTYKMARLALVLIMIFLFPFLSMLVFAAMDHSTIYFTPIYGICLFYPFCLIIIFDGINLMISKHYYKEMQRFIKAFLCIISVFILSYYIKYANGAYSIQDVIYTRGQSIMTRVMNDINEIDSYVPGKTKVIIIGRFNDVDSNVTWVTDLGDYQMLAGYAKTAITYDQTLGSFANLLGERINIETDEEIIKTLQNEALVKDMPIYPQKGYVKNINDTIVVKFSNR